MSEHQPHHQPGAWHSLIEELGVETIFVVISSWLNEHDRIRFTVEDLWQDTLFMAWRDRHQHEWNGIRKFRAWLLGIARNRFREALQRDSAAKRGGRTAAEPLSILTDDEHASISGLLPAGTLTPSRVAGHNERLVAMEQSLNALPDRTRLVVWSYLFEERPMREVAELVGVSLSTAKRMFREGSQQYRDHLHQRLDTRVEGSMCKR